MMKIEIFYVIFVKMHYDLNKSNPNKRNNNNNNTIINVNIVINSSMLDIPQAVCLKDN